MNCGRKYSVVIIFLQWSIYYRERRRRRILVVAPMIMIMRMQVGATRPRGQQE
jgi:hypothetical protein